MRRAAALGGAAVVAAAAAVLAPTLVRDGGPGGGRPGGAISVRTTLSPRAHLFGDHVRARVDVAFDPRRVDPASVAVRARFAPYTPVGSPRVRRGRSSLRLEADLVCLTRACLPNGAQREIDFPAAKVRFREGSRSGAVGAAWPPLLVASRLGPSDLRRPALREHAAPPPVSAAVDPEALGWALAAAAGLLLLVAGGAVARRLAARPRTGEELRAEQVPALRSALAGVARLADESDEARRAALDRLARTLDAAGLARLSPQARLLAWSEPIPSAEPMRRLTAEIEAVLGEEAA